MHCEACGRVLAGDVFPGGAVHCPCGAATATAPPNRESRPDGGDGGVYRTAAERPASGGVITCPCCGGPCASGARACPHCDVELASVRCPHCFALHFPGSRFCARCGRELELEPLLDATDAPCPRCKKPLSVARPGAGSLTDELEALAVLHECVACGGVFLDSASLRRVLARAPHGSGAGARTPHGAPPISGAMPDPVRYLNCPLCNELMNRVNFGRRSGIIVDVCRPHGTWFDAGELTSALEFAAGGGLEESMILDAAEKRDLARAAAEVSSAGRGGATTVGSSEAGVGAVGWGDFARVLVDILAGLFR